MGLAHEGGRRGRKGRNVLRPYTCRPAGVVRWRSNGPHPPIGRRNAFARGWDWRMRGGAGGARGAMYCARTPVVRRELYGGEVTDLTRPLAGGTPLPADGIGA